MGQRRQGFGRLRRERYGRYTAAYVGPDLRLHRAPETFKAKIDAEGWLAAEHRQIDLNQWVSPERRYRRVVPDSDPTVATYATAWLADRSERDANDPMALRPSSLKDYELTIKNQILPKLGSIHLAELDATDIETWYRALGQRKTPRARAKAYSLLRTIHNAAKNDPNAPITENPAHIKGAGRVPRSTQIHPASLDELRVITQAMPDKLRLAVQLGAWCALRYGEVFELRRKDLDLQAGVVHVRRASSGREVR
jgi:integrase